MRVKLVCLVVVLLMSPIYSDKPTAQQCPNCAKRYSPFTAECSRWNSTRTLKSTTVRQRGRSS